MASIVEICNSGLSMLGASTIASLTEDSKNARLCNQRFEPVRDAVFRNHSWNCLMKRASIAEDSVAPTWGWTKSYTLPSDCLRVMKLESDDPVLSSEIEHKLEGRKIVTNEGSPLKILYIARITDPNEYDVLLQEVLATRLAAELAYAITASTSLSQIMMAAYQDKLREARHADATEGYFDQIEANTFINSRY